MKKTATLIVILCLFVGILGDVNYSVSAEEIPRNYIVETRSYSPSQKEQLNYVFSEKELKNTSYEGQEVEIIEGELYMNRFSNMTDAYADEQQNLKSVKLSNGNQCVLALGVGHFNSMYSS